MAITVPTRARIVDGTVPEPGAPTRVVIENGLIREASGTDMVPNDARAVDLRGRALMPGLIDMPTSTWSLSSPAWPRMPLLPTRWSPRAPYACSAMC